jgi:hypothetical protein
MTSDDPVFHVRLEAPTQLAVTVTESGDELVTAPVSADETGVPHQMPE